MSGLDAILADTRVAADALLAAADGCATVWSVPRAPGKWSPAQIVEHVARALEESAHVINGEPSKFPTFPGFFRPVPRVMFFNRVLKKGAFSKAKTNPAMNPARGPDTPADARVRLDEALAAFAGASRARAVTTPTFEHVVFGTVAVSDYARFQELHIRHHTAQMPVAAGLAG